MEPRPLIPNLAKAIISVMLEVKSIDKSMTIGEGKNAYKGVPDEAVKEAIGESMAKNGLCCLPIGIEETTEITRWEEQTNWGPKPKQSVFTKVITTYLLLHESGESVEIKGYGHGIDPQDKGAGKATTYALKYAALYTFFVPTKKIDDTDKGHSDKKETPPQAPPKDNRPFITPKMFNQLLEKVRDGNTESEEKTKAAFQFLDTQLTELELNRPFTNETV